MSPCGGFKHGAIRLPASGPFRVVLDTDPQGWHSVGRLLLLSAYWFGLAYLWQPLTVFVLPILIGQLTQPTTIEVGSLNIRLDRNTFLGLVGGIGTAVAVVWQPMVGAISDRSRFGMGRRRPYILAGALCTVLALVLLSGASSIWWLLVTYVFLQLSSNTAQGPYQGMLPDQIPDDQRGRASAFYGALQLLAILVGAIVIGVVLVPRGGLRWAILSMGVVIAVTAAMVVVGVADVVTTRSPNDNIGRKLLLCFAIDTRRYSDFAWLMVSRLFFLVGLLGVQQYLLYYLQALFHLTEQQASAQAGYVLVSGLVVSTAASFAGGYLSERWGRKPIVTAACLLGTVCSLLFIGVHSLAALLGVGAFLGIASGTFFSVDWAFATDLVPKDEAGRYMGLSNVVTAGAAVLAGLIMGPTIDIVNHGRPSTDGYTAMFMVAGVLFLAALATLQRVRERRPSVPA